VVLLFTPQDHSLNILTAELAKHLPHPAAYETNIAREKKRTAPLGCIGGKMPSCRLHP